MSWQLASFLILGAVLLGGFAWYERSRPTSQIVALVAALAALAIAGRVAFAALPNVVATTDVVIFAGFALGPAPGFAVGALAGLVSNFWLGQGPWTPWQMAGWGMCGVLGAALAVVRPRAGRLTLAAFCGLAGIAYGALMNFSLMATYGGDLSLERFLALQSRAVPFDAAHAVGNATIALIAGPAMVRMLVRFRKRFEWRAPAVASLLLLALALASVLPAQARAADTSRAAGWLVAAQNADGGWGASAESDSAADMTAWAMLGLEAAGRNPLDVSRGGRNPVGYLRSRVDELGSPGDLARTILALYGAGVDPRSFGGRDLVSALAQRRRGNGSFEGWPGSTAFAIIALRSAGAGAAQGDDRERGRARPAFEGAVAAPPLGQRRDEIAAAEGARIDPGAMQGENRAGEVAGAAELADAGAQVADRVAAPAGDVERVAAGRLQPQHRPGRHVGGRVALRRGPPAAVGVLRGDQPTGGAARVGGAGLGRQHAGQRQGQQEQRGDGGGAPLEALAETDQHPHHRRPGDQGDRRVADRVGGVEGHGARLQSEKTLQRKVPSIGRHKREVQQSAVGDACQGADGGKSHASGARPDDGQRGAQQAAHPPAGHLPGRPGALAEPEVRDQPGQRPDREAGSRAEREAAEDDDVGGGDDVGQGREGDPAGDGEGREGGDQGDDLRRRARALVPGEATEQDGGEDDEAGQLPTHRSRSRLRLSAPCSGVITAGRSRS